MQTSQASAAVLQLSDITVRYGSFTALENINVAFTAGQIHAVVGQNGAGKTTFARVVCGLVAPIAGGHLRVHGLRLATGSVMQARQHGVELVHQSFALPPTFTIAEAMEFGTQRGSALYTKKQLHMRWQEHLHALDVQASLHTQIRDLPIETQQSVEIARALAGNDTRILILDEPTAVLSPSSIEKLFTRVQGLTARGITVLLILHKIREVLAIADSITVLRDGRLIAAGIPGASIDAQQLSTFIIGDTPLTRNTADTVAASGLEVPAGGAAADQPRTPQSPQISASAQASAAVLELKNVFTARDPEGPALEHFSLVLRPGEIVGVAGVEGNGQKTLVKTIAGLMPCKQGQMWLSGENVSHLAAGDLRRRGLRIIPFERNIEGLSLSASLWENWAVSQLVSGRLFRYLQPTRLQQASRSVMQNWQVKFETPTQKAASLSGGNAQKLIFSREMDAAAKLIIAAQPARGLDIGAMAFVWEALRKARDRGCAVLLISSDLDELFDISDRIIVMLSGQIVGTFTPPWSRSRVGAAMTGAHA